MSESEGYRGRSVLDSDEDAPRVVVAEDVVGDDVGDGVRCGADGDVRGVHDDDHQHRAHAVRGGERGVDCGCVNRPPSIAKHPMPKVSPLKKRKVDGVSKERNL